MVWSDVTTPSSNVKAIDNSPLNSSYKIGPNETEITLLVGDSLPTESILTPAINEIVFVIGTGNA